MCYFASVGPSSLLPAPQPSITEPHSPSKCRFTCKLPCTYMYSVHVHTQPPPSFTSQNPRHLAVVRANSSISFQAQNTGAIKMAPIRKDDIDDIEGQSERLPRPAAWSELEKMRADGRLSSAHRKSQGHGPVSVPDHGADERL